MIVVYYLIAEGCPDWFLNTNIAAWMQRLDERQASPSFTSRRIWEKERRPALQSETDPDNALGLLGFMLRIARGHGFSAPEHPPQANSTDFSPTFNPEQHRVYRSRFILFLIDANLDSPAADLEALVRGINKLTFPWRTREGLLGITTYLSDIQDGHGRRIPLPPAAHYFRGYSSAHNCGVDLPYGRDPHSGRRDRRDATLPITTGLPPPKSWKRLPSHSTSTVPPLSLPCRRRGTRGGGLIADASLE